MRLMVTGGAGVVGSQLCSHLVSAGHEVVPVDVVGDDGVRIADLRDAETARVLLADTRPQVLLHLAANKNVFFCEEQPDTAHVVNFGMTETLAHLCAEMNVRIIFFSSDYVFGGEDSVWCEDDSPCPTTQYGRDKAASEQLLAELNAGCALMRTSGLYGFSGDLVHVVREVLSKGELFKAFDNLINCPTWIGDLFRMVDAVLETGATGVFHCVGPEAMSRFDYARIVAEEFGLDVSLVQGESLDFSHDVRPPSLRLDGSRTYERLGTWPGTLKNNLKEMKDE